MVSLPQPCDRLAQGAIRVVLLSLRPRNAACSSRYICLERPLGAATDCGVKMTGLRPIQNICLRHNDFYVNVFVGAVQKM